MVKFRRSVSIEQFDLSLKQKIYGIKKGRNLMETVYTSSWLNRLHLLSSRILMPLMAVLFICTNTVINLWIDERMETIQNIIAILLLLMVICYLLSAPRERLRPWIKSNILVIAYFVVRLISLWQCGFDYSVIRTICFEMFFLIGICGFTVDSRTGNRFYVKFFIWFEVIATALSALIFLLMPHLGANMQHMIIEFSYYEKAENAAFFSNVNTAGIMAGFSIVLAFIMYHKDMFAKKLIIVFGIYNICALLYFGSRAAEVGMAAVVLFFVIKKVFSGINAKKLTIVALCLMVLTLVPLYAMIGYHESQATLSYRGFERKLDNVSTGRYSIWKECYITQKDSLLVGMGNLKLEQDARKEMVAANHCGEYWWYEMAAELGPHNGYISMISGAGWLGLLLFIAILIQRIRRSKNLEKGNWYLMLVFIFAINCFESLFILNRFFACFYMFLILESDWEKEDDANQIVFKL